MGKSNKLFLLMPSHRRSASKLSSSSSSSKSHGYGDDRGTLFGLDSTHSLQPESGSPKHVTLPKMPSENELLVEAQTMLLLIVAIATQYLNLYRTVWWLNQSHTNTAMNFHLIDLNAVQFSMLFIGRPFLQLLAHSITNALPSLLRVPYSYTSAVLILVLCTWGQIRCALFVYTNHGVTGILCIGYPLVIYVLMYFPNIIQAYESSKSGDTRLNILIACLKAIVLPTKFSANPPTHTCSCSAEVIREEVDRLKSCFNDRLKFILFRSLLIAYYSSFVPLCLAQTQLFYDISWTAQHVVISWLSSFLMLTSHLYSPQFYDILHKSALHLGKWQKLETRNTLVPCTAWGDNFLYSQGVVVKHSKEYFKAEGVANCAEPGNQSHLRYYIVFSNPVGGFGTLLGLLVMLVLFQIVLLVRAHEWYKLISMSLLIVVNSLTVFRLVRSYYVLREVYRVEETLSINKDYAK